MSIYQQNCDKFQEIFRVPLRRFWSNLTGFDIIKFDEEFLNPLDGESISEAVKERFGSEGVKLIEKLLQFGFMKHP